MTACQQSSIDNSILNFRLIVEQVRFGTLNLKLPSVFNTYTFNDESAPTKNKGKGDKETEVKDNKKEKGKKNNKRAVNNSPPEAFKLIQGKTWGGSYANKNIIGRVTWKGKIKMCPHWLINTHCFDNCINADSHVEGKDIPNSKITEFSNFTQVICNQNN
jgi:hypothetical protein